MIPKIIHYCWFGGNELPQLARKCIASWKKKCPDYEIKEWNETNFKIEDCPVYVKEAYKEKKWAFVTDYARLKIVYDEGGIYLDTDVELKRSLDPFLSRRGFFGYENGIHIATGLGFGSVPQNRVLQEMMEDYDEIHFMREDGSYDLTPCPQRNTKILLKYGLKQNDEMQLISDNILILPTIYLCPISYTTGKRKWSYKTVAIHWFSGSWKKEEEQKQHWENLKLRRRKELIDYILHTPNRTILRLLGTQRYEKLKKILKN